MEGACLQNCYFLLFYRARHVRAVQFIDTVFAFERVTVGFWMKIREEKV